MMSQQTCAVLGVLSPLTIFFSLAKRDATSSFSYHPKPARIGAAPDGMSASNADMDKAVVA